MIFKTILKVLNKCKFPVILYTGLLIFFAGVNMSSNDTSMDFTIEKPSIMVINNDVQEGLTKNFLDYLNKTTEIKDIKQDEKVIKDALFYREIQYIVYIPEHFRENFVSGKNPQIEIKSTGEYQSTLANMIVERFIKVANNYVDIAKNEEELLEKINSTLDKKVDVEVTSKMDTTSISRLTRYYNFSAYSFIAISIYVICTIMLKFNEKKMYRRTVVGSIDYRKINTKLLIANSGFCFLVWAIYIVFARILIGEVAFSKYGLYMSINSLVFVISTVTLGFLVSKFVKNKNTITAMINVIGLGSSFLCGVFVPMEFLPDFVLKIAHVLPAYWFVKNNELIGSTENFTFDIFKNLGINIAVILAYALVFYVATNIASKKKMKAE